MDFDAIMIGGGLAGSTLGTELAKSGWKVVILERETTFKDRVRGENMLPWGVSAARRLGIMEPLLEAGAIQPPFWMMYMNGQPSPPRDLRATTPDGESQLNIYHPTMQEVLLARAAANRVEIMRGATGLGVEAAHGSSPSVTYESNGTRHTLTSRVVVGSDGRASQVRRWMGFKVKTNPDMLTIAGLLIEGTDVPQEGVHLFFGNQKATLLAPLGNKRARVYFVYPNATGPRRLSGNEKIPEFLRLSQEAGAPAAWFVGARPIGPLAEFNGADRWVESPAENGVALIGDAAAASDPSWGSGLSLTVHDVERLANALRSSEDVNLALERYAKEHDEYYGALKRILSWMTELIWSHGPEADARRGKVFGRMMQDPRGFPDSVGLGPFGPNDEQARKLILGLDE